MTVTLIGLSKRYGATLALDSVDLTVRSGEVHALLGHNGAGKSTLIKCLGGSVRPSSGSISMDGRPLEGLTPRSSIDAGISVIYQHLGLIDTLSVAENLFLGMELSSGPLLRRGEQAEVAAASLARIGASIPPRTMAGALSMGQRQQVAIAKALQRNASLLILDEPTAALSPVEAGALGQTVLQLREEGIAILYVTHLLNEVMALADEVTVLRNGQAVWSSPMATVTKHDLVAAISDGGPSQASLAHPIDRTGVPRLRVPNLETTSGDTTTLDVQAGEIVALYGLIGSGRTQLLETLFGTRGRSRPVELDGVATVNSSPSRALASGVALVPGDRHSQGLFGSLPAQENIVTRAMGQLSKGGIRATGMERRIFDEAAALLSIRPHNPALPASRFSGGNQQKLLIARWVNSASDARVLLIDDPSQGVDVGARAEIYSVLRSLALDKGIGIVFATNEPEEVVALAHRCVVMQAGRVARVLDVADSSAEELLTLIHPNLDTHHFAESDIA